MVIFHSYVSLPEGNFTHCLWIHVIHDVRVSKNYRRQQPCWLPVCQLILDSWVIDLFVFHRTGLGLIYQETRFFLFLSYWLVVSNTFLLSRIYGIILPID